MPRKKSDVKKPTGCPPKVIDWEKVDQMLIYQCPGTEIAATLKVGDNTLYERCKREKGMTFSEYSQTVKGIGKSMLRQAQMELALEKDRGMLIHLGEHLLDQVKQEKIEHSGNVNISIKQFRVSRPTDTLEQESDG